MIWDIMNFKIKSINGYKEVLENITYNKIYYEMHAIWEITLNFCC